MPEKRAAKILVRQSELATRLGLPSGTTVHRMELDTSELDPVLELTVTGPGYPVCYSMLQRMPLEEVAATVVYTTMPTAADAMNTELERVKTQVYERYAQGLDTKLMVDGEVIAQIAGHGRVLFGAVYGTMVLQADSNIDERDLVAPGPDGGVVRWVEGDVGRPMGRALTSARRGDAVKVRGEAVPDPR